MRPGHENLVAMGAISTVADDAIKCKLTFIFQSKCNGNSNDNETLIAVDFNVKDRSNLIHTIMEMEYKSRISELNAT